MSHIPYLSDGETEAQGCDLVFPNYSRAESTSLPVSAPIALTAWILPTVLTHVTLHHTSKHYLLSPAPPPLNCKGPEAGPGHSHHQSPLVLRAQSLNNWLKERITPQAAPHSSISVCTEINPPNHQTVTLKHTGRSVPQGRENVYILMQSKQPPAKQVERGPEQWGRGWGGGRGWVGMG